MTVHHRQPPPKPLSITTTTKCDTHTHQTDHVTNPHFHHHRRRTAHTDPFTTAVIIIKATNSYSTFNKLADGGDVKMPLGDHGFSPRFGWLTDLFGVSWQFNLPQAQ